MKTIPISITALHCLVKDLLFALGSAADSANHIARSLIKSDMCGISTHGVGLLPIYALMVNDEAIIPHATASLNFKTETILHIDGHSSFGQQTGAIACVGGIKAAKKSGLALVAIQNGSHLGRLGEWAEQACDAGLVFTAYCNSGGGAKNVAAFGGYERKLSTNPVAFGVPTFDALPYNIIVDFATSQVSGSVIREHYRSDTPLNDEWTTNGDNEPVSDALSFMKGEGAILPLGGRTTGHKGYALSIVAELLGGITGGMIVGQHDPKWFSNSAMFSFFDPLHLSSKKEIEEKVITILNHLDEENVRLPGKGSYEKFTHSEKNGLSLEPHILVSLVKLAEELKVKVADELITSISDIEIEKSNLVSW
jgi:hydroxycarboxylate dehydrogenase B